MANGYDKVVLHVPAIDNCFFGGAECDELFSCPPRTGSSRYLLISETLCTFDHYCNTSIVTIRACVNVCSNSSDTSNANILRVF